MELKQQVTSLDLSKRLKELGVKQESAFAWVADMETPDTRWRLWHSGAIEEWVGPWRKAAFTVAELGEMLPEFIESYKSHDEGFNWFCRKFEEGDILKYTALETADTEADARGKMLIYLLENGLLADK